MSPPIAGLRASRSLAAWPGRLGWLVGLGWLGWFGSLAAAPLAAADLGIEVRDKAGRPVQGAAVTIAGPAGATQQGRTSDIGRTVFADLAPGEWSVTIEHPEFMRFNGWVDARPGKVAKETFSTQVATERSWLPIRVSYFAPASRDARTVQPGPPLAALAPPPPTVRPSPGPTPPAPTPRVAPPSHAAEPPPANRSGELIPPPAPAPIAAAAEPAPPSSSPSAPPAPAAAPESPAAPAASVPAPPSVPAKPATPAAISAPPPVAPPAAPTPASATPPVDRPREPLAPRPSQTQEPRPETRPAPAATPPLPGAASTRPSPYRSRALGSCPECKPGEWAASVQVAALGGTGCEADQAARLGAEFNAAAAEATGEVWSSGEAPCRLLAVRLPPGSRFLGYRFEAEDNRRAADCVGDEPCPVGEARFLGHPSVRKSDGPWIWAIFENRAGAPRLARLTAFFSAPAGWQASPAR